MIERRAGGFTLLELMLALSVLAVMVVIVSGTFRVGVRAWEKGESDIETRHRERIVLEQVRRQMASTSTRPLLNNGQDPFFPLGTEKRLQFISEVPVLPGDAFGLVFVEYRVERGPEDLAVLKIFERNLVFLEESFLDHEPDEDQFLELLPGLKDASFAYRSRPEEGQEGVWQEEWQPESEKKFPRGIKLSVTPAGPAPAVSIIAGIEWQEGS